MTQAQTNLFDQVDCMEVSVIIPAFNAARTITRAVDSVIRQNISSIEIIIIDDGSSDQTYDLCNELALTHPVIRVLKLPTNCGVSAARNVGIQSSRGKYLAFLDADDIWLEGKLSKQIAELKSDNSISLISCNSRMVSESGEFLKVGHINRPPVEGNDSWKTLLIYNFLPTPTVLTYRKLVLELGGFDEKLQVGEDLDLWIKLALRGKVQILKDILVHYYDSKGSLMKRHQVLSHSIVFPMLEKHLVEQKDKLSKVEIRSIRGQHSFQTGCNLFFSGKFLASIPLFLMAFSKGTLPLKSLLYISRALFMAAFSREK
ncbi:glycosyltransferase family 2 protein [Undibacterium sp. SXout20W]|uniref:glycosyltransferase family 2 protein n=1 Tax=Undibacterium sp. SXout20W TaxID=3413051 RepID=UPI003BF331B5